MACTSSRAYIGHTDWHCCIGRRLQLSSFCLYTVLRIVGSDCSDLADGSCAAHPTEDLTVQQAEPEPWAQRCNIRRQAAPPKGQDFAKSATPYIVSLSDNRNHALTKLLERENLLAEMGNMTCTPSAAGSTRKGIYEMRLRDYIEYWMTKELSRNPEENRYVFGEFSDEWAPMRDLYVLPPCRPCIREKVAITIGLGGLHSGAPWHFHNGAFVEMLHGRKYFALVPPGDKVIPVIDETVRNISQLHWHREVRPGLEREGRLAHLQECVIQRGEILYFPSNWHHGAVNMDPYTAFVSTFLEFDDS